MSQQGRHLVFLNCVSIIQVRQLSKLLAAEGIEEEEEDGEVDEQEQTYPIESVPESRGVGGVRGTKRVMWEDCWALDTQVLQLFNTKRGLHGNEPNNHYKNLRKSALNGQFIRIGRQDADSGVIHDVTAGGGSGALDAAARLTLKPQQYLQLTAEGRAQLSGDRHGEGEY